MHLMLLNKQSVALNTLFDCSAGCGRREDVLWCNDQCVCHVAPDRAHHSQLFVSPVKYTLLYPPIHVAALETRCP